MNEKIDINMADSEMLATISGIGPALAQRIIEYRETVRPFEEVIELTAVPGISEKMVRGFADLVTVQPTAVATGPDEAEETILLDAPEPMELLEAPEQPEALLAAELPEPDIEEEIVVDATEDVAAEVTVEQGSEEIDSTEDAPAEEVAAANVDETDDDGAEEMVISEELEQVEEEVETAVSAPDDPDIEAIPLAEPDPTMPEPSMRASIPTQPSGDWEARSQRRGCLNTLLGATFGAILGAVLTLAILAAVNNGTINYAFNDSEIRQQLDTEIISRTNELNSLSTRVSLVATQEAAANQSFQSELEAASEAFNEEMANNEEIVSYLATRSGDFELRLQDVAGAAETFTDFLDGMRLLLDDLDQSPATPLPPASTRSTATPTGADMTSSPTPLSLTPLPTPTAVQPTRTPQPTATSFTFPTNTPAPQP